MLKKNEDKKTWHQLSTWGSLYSKSVKIANVEVALRSLSSVSWLIPLQGKSEYGLILVPR